MKALVGLAILLHATVMFAQSPMAPPAGSVLLLTARAKGVQIYTCKALAYDAAHAEPDALLSNERGEIIIHHYLNADPAGPAWESKDGSKIVARKLDPAEPHSGTIPWLLLQVIAHEGNGALAKVTHIQRVDTAGGVAPAGSCESDKRVRVPYTATYKFFGTK